MSGARRNVLISSAGRRASLVRIAQRAAGRLGGTVVATDLDPKMSSACHLADRSIAVPPTSSPEYLPSLKEVCERFDVGLVIPTLDTELLTFAAVRDEWAGEGITISVSDERFVARCRDKRATAEFFADLGVATPREIVDESTFPRFIKPVAGSLSKDIHLVDRADGYDPSLADRDAYIHQELVDRQVYDEFTVDLFYNREGRLVCAVPRRRLEVRGGEVSKGRTEKGPLHAFLRDRLAVIPGARGCLTAQFFCARNWTGCATPVLGIEVNPRFGGGYPLTDEAGGHYVEWLLDETFTDRPTPLVDDWRDGVVMLRYDAEVFLA